MQSRLRRVFQVEQDTILKGRGHQQKPKRTAGPTVLLVDGMAWRYWTLSSGLIRTQATSSLLTYHGSYPPLRNNWMHPGGTASIHSCVCVYMSVSMGTCIIYVCMYVLMCMYVYACVYVCASVWMPICMCACVCVCGGEGSLRKGSWPILTLKTCYFPVVGWIFLPTASINSLTAIFTHFLALLGPRASKEVFRVGPYLSW